MAVLLHSESAQQRSRIALGIPAFEFGETLLQFGCTDSVSIGKILLCIDGILLLHDIPEYSVSLQNCIHNGTFIKFEVVLLKHAHTLARALGNITMGGGNLSAQYFHES